MYKHNMPVRLGCQQLWTKILMYKHRLRCSQFWTKIPVHKHIMSVRVGYSLLWTKKPHAGKHIMPVRLECPLIRIESPKYKHNVYKKEYDK